MSKKAHAALWLTVVLAAACLVRLPLVLADDFPVNDGGVFPGDGHGPGDRAPRRARLHVVQPRPHPLRLPPLGIFLTAAVAARFSVAFHARVRLEGRREADQTALCRWRRSERTPPFVAVYDGPGATVFARR